jgi:hydrophobe/amphiphile efflux-1 (HAE1) family protein
MDYEIIYDPTEFVRQSISAVIQTLLEAIALVVLVVILFLQTWRASIIPLVAVPVSVIGTFAVLYAFGFSINTLSLFGLVLAIGIVVDDSIVVVENVERHIANGLKPLEATKKAMSEVSRPIIAITLVLCAVFIPVAFVEGLTGQFYKQFALTIAISTVISAFNSLTLSPALAAVLLKPHDAKPDALTRGMDKVFGRFFARFNKIFTRTAESYSGTVTRAVRRVPIAIAVYTGLIALTALAFYTLPSGFIPQQDKNYLVGIVQLPPASSIDRTSDVVHRMGEIAKAQPGVLSSVQFAGVNANGFAPSSSSALVFFPLKDFSERSSPELSAGAIAGALNQKFHGIQDAYIAVFPPPPVIGLGTLGGFKLNVEDRQNRGAEALYAAVQDALGKAWADPRLAGVFSSYQINVPQLDVNVDRLKAKQQGVKVSDVFQTLQAYLGSVYVNDFNRFGRTYRVVAQADAPFRSQVDDILPLKTRNAAGEMVPLGSMISVEESFGPDLVERFNGYPSADINGGPSPGHSSGEAQAVISKILDESLPHGMTYEWTDLAYQQIDAGSSALWVFPLCVLFVFLVLAAQYESFSLPLAIILIVPLAVLSGAAGIYLQGGDINIFTQIGFLVLVALASKNAILIVEFAKHLEDEGRDRFQAVLEAARLRLRPIVMTSIAFIMGVMPLVLASGAGSEVRRAMGATVFAGMIGVTLFGLLLTPVFYVLVRRARATPTAAPVLPAPITEGSSHA